MDKRLFKARTEHLLKYHKTLDRDRLISSFRPCEYCRTEVKNQRIECTAYRLGTDHAHFKHVCRPCNFVLFDGSLVKDASRHRLPPGPMLIVNANDQDELAAPRIRTGRGRTKPIQTPAGQFVSLTAAALHYKKIPCMMLHTMRKNPEEYYYI
jgi:hypothetical protein